MVILHNFIQFLKCQISNHELDSMLISEAIMRLQTHQAGVKDGLTSRFSYESNLLQVDLDKNSDGIDMSNVEGMTSYNNAVTTFNQKMQKLQNDLNAKINKITNEIDHKVARLQTKLERIEALLKNERENLKNYKEALDNAIKKAPFPGKNS